MEEKESLVKKLARKMADFTHAVGKSKIVKGAATTMLALGIATAAAGCQIHIENDPPIDQTQDGGNKEDLNNQGNQQGNQNQQGGSTTPTTPTEPDYSQYSPILQDILKSDYYNDLIAKHKVGQLEITGKVDGGANLVESIPYNFLESQGEDVEAIKNNDIAVGCGSYIINENKNELFLRVCLTFGTDDKTKYDKNYLLKYQISDKELEDYTMLTKGTYYQGNFFIQELDNQREAELVNEFCINRNTYNSLLSAFNREANKLSPVFQSKSVSNFVITNIQKDKELDDYWLNLDFYSDTKDSSNVTQREKASAYLRVNSICYPKYNNEIFSIDSAPSLLTKEVSSPSPITYFHNYSPKMNNFIK